MTDSSARFSAPINAPRPRGARLLTAFSPTLERAVRAFDHHGLWQWVRLETNPQILSFCEHPVRLGKDNGARLIDFWVQRGDGEELLVLDRDRAIDKIPATLDGIAVRLVPAAELAAAGTWITNWLRMLPVISATRGLVPKNLLRAATNLVREPVALSLVEHELAVGDPSLVRGAIFELLRTGRLLAPSLHSQALSLHTTIEPAR
jgi:hypothetical protein